METVCVVWWFWRLWVPCSVGRRSVGDGIRGFGDDAVVDGGDRAGCGVGERAPFGGGDDGGLGDRALAVRERGLGQDRLAPSSKKLENDPHDRAETNPSP